MFAVRRTALTVLLWKIHRALYRATGGRFGSRLGRLRVLLLVTRGRRSGERREVALNYFEHERTPIVVGSNAGDDRHPAWYLNLEAEPVAEIHVAGSVRHVRARRAGGEERERLWRRLVALDPSYETYRVRTSREIPIVLLEPLDRPA